MKKLIVLTAIISTLFVMPVFGQSEEVITVGDELECASDSNLTAQFEEAKNHVMECYYKYTTTVVNIRKEPSLDAEILGQSEVNTRFEVVVDIDGWSMITTEDGYAFMKSDWFVDEPIQLPSYTEEDLDILTHLLTGECHTYPDEEQLLVGSVVLNRVNSPDYPNTVKGVVFQKGQYACIWDGNYYREPTENNRDNAKWLLENGSVLPENVVYQSGGKQGSGVYLKTDYHYYCYR